MFFGFGSSFSPSLRTPEGWADFAASGYSPAWPSLDATASSHLYWDEWTGFHIYEVGEGRVRRADVAVPGTCYDITELAVPFWANAADSTMNHYPDGFDCWMGPDFSGPGDERRFGVVYSGGTAFAGWLAWFGRWNGETVSFSYRWPGIEAGYWGGPHVHDDYLGVNLEGSMSIIGGFDFEGYRNGEWSPIGDGEWGINHV